MPIEEDDVGQQGNTGQDNTGQDNTGQQPQQQDTGTQERTPTGGTEDLLTNFMRETDRGPARGTGQGAPGTQQPGTQQPGAGQGQQGRQPRGTGADGTGTVQQVPQAARQYGQMFLADTRGDIYNARGELIAKQGYGRSIFHKLYPYIEAASTENAAMKTRLDNYERANTIAKENGLTLDDHGAAMQLMVNWKKNPVETITTLLRIAQERGIDVSPIRGGAAFDPAALRTTVAELLQEHLKPFQPFVEQQQRDIEDREAHDRVVGEYNTFMQEFPDAAPHQMSIANVMRDHNMTHREAYFALRSYAAEKGLNWQQDLKPQLERLANTSGNGQGGPSGSGNDRDLPAMGGRSNGADTVGAGSRNVGSPDESWDSIARRTFEQHGVKFS